MQIKAVFCPNSVDCGSCFLKFRLCSPFVSIGQPSPSETSSDDVLLKPGNEMNYFYSHVAMILRFQKDLSPVCDQAKCCL